MIKRKNPNGLYDDNGKLVAQLKNGWIEKGGIDPAKHKLRSPEGYATDHRFVLKLCEMSEPKGIRLRLVDGTVLEATLADIIAHSLRINSSHGEPIVFPFNWWAYANAPKQGQMF